MGEVVKDLTIEIFDEPTIEKYWPSISQQLDTITHLWADKWTKDAIYQSLLNGGTQAWGLGRERITLIVLTQVVQYPAAKFLNIMLPFGEMSEEELNLMDATFEVYARASGCEYIEATGREGWARLLRQRGVKVVSVTCQRRVYHGGLQ